MHETGLVEGIVDAVQRRAGDRRVASVRVRIGVLHRAHQGPMELAWEMLGAGTVVDGSRLELSPVPVTSTCAGCGRVDSGPDRVPWCAGCGGTDVEHAGGDELTLEAISYRAPGAIDATVEHAISSVDHTPDDDESPWPVRSERTA
jgi:hydrogenase nickel incorporation protein HypA/HybF